MVKPKGKYAWSVKVGEKGQIVIPKEARDLFGISPGDTLILLGDEKKGMAIPTKNTLFSFTTKIFGDKTPEEEDDE
ncbi:MAG: AbrB/MazE/SpoVT family DNA-binding domain-containing protein [Clostridiales bacterium]|nr:AbrB/MazE/SpoVT family DNA-binding domain-containing protein [Clostridiales bacterium]